MRKIALLFLVHRSPEQLLRLLKRMDDERFDFYIHVDAKTNIERFLPITHHIKKSQIHWVHNRVKTYLNDFSLIEATCNTTKVASEGEEDYMYYVLLTGQDYPIKSNEFIYDKLSSAYPMSFIDMYGISEAYQSGVMWVEHIGYSYFSQSLRKKIQDFVGRKFYYSPCGRTVKIIPKLYDIFATKLIYSPRKRIVDTEYTYSAGSHFWILPDIAIRHIIDKSEYDKNINEIFHHIAAPEESYFQTVLSSMEGLKLPNGMLEQFNSMDKEMDNPALRLIKWYEDGKHTSGHPGVWKMGDVSVIDSALALFARKFDINKDSNILDYLDLKQ